MALTIVNQADNDLCRLLQNNNIIFDQTSSAQKAVEDASEGSGIFILADGYPDTPTPIDLTVLDMAREKGLRIYLEFPNSLPDMGVGELRGVEWERAVVTSDVFSPLEKGRILMIHGCRFVDVACQNPHIALARIAGFDHAVYGLPDKIFPILFEHSQGHVLVATTKLSQFQTGRYAPAEAWQTIWQWILSYVTGAEQDTLVWTPTVQPAFKRDGALPEDVETRAIERGVQWFHKARLFVHPEWVDEAKRRVVDFPDGTGIGPDEQWPVGDGRLGMMEGASSRIHANGAQDWRYFLRNDCMGEASMALSFGQTVCNIKDAGTVAGNLNDFIYFHSDFAGGPRGNPDSPSFGLVRWHNSDGDGVYYGDDNARSMLGTIATAALLNESRWDESVLRCLLANLRTTGPLGFRSGRLTEKVLQEKGWRHFWTTERTHFAPHYESWLWACFLWAYQQTQFKPFLERARTAIHMTMAVYPDQWRWTNGFQQERARLLLSLSWLVRVDDTAQHRQWLRTIAQDMLKAQDACGAIREELGVSDRGSYGVPKTNEAYGTAEAPLIQENGDPLCDLLYTTNFAFIGLHEAGAATGEAFYKEAEDRLADFLCRIQIVSQERPELDGAWFRAFDFGRWDYWASNADLGWGAWSIESGWTQGWITAVLSLRHLRTSFWDLTANNRLKHHVDQWVSQMLPE